MKIGDTIQCHDKDDLINTMIECARLGIETDSNYDDDKPKLVVTAISETPKNADILKNAKRNTSKT